MLSWFIHNWFFTLLLINYGIALSAAFFLLKSNQNPHKTLSSLLFLVALPFIGLGIYYFFGLEYRKAKIFKRKDLSANKLITSWEERLNLPAFKLDEFEKTFLQDRLKLVKLVRHNQKASLTLRNQVKLLRNGEEKFRVLFEDLDSATNHIHLEYFILNDDTIGNKIIDKLIAAVDRGVKVRLIYDAVGSSLSRKAKQKMTDAGIVHYPFMPVLFTKLTRKANYRNHRKIVIIDGHIGYLGGVNISDDYINESSKPEKLYWRDTHVRIEGDAVKTLQEQWLLNWFFVSKTANDDCEVSEALFPEIDEEKQIPIQIAASGPDTDWANIMEALFLAINSADDYIKITTPYFIPNQAMLTALTSASRSGVKIQLMVPKIGDSWAARYASRSYFEKLLDSGVEIYWYTKGMLHAKTMVVDDMFATVGTSNMDYRSFEINFEINALFYNEDIACELSNTFENDLADCELIDKERWESRNKLERFKESFCRLWAPLL